MSVSPKVTVVIPIYNRAGYIASAIESILAQRFTDFELLLLDDGSTDGGVEIVRAHTDPRVRLVCNGANLGIPTTRNKGLQLAQGEYLAMLDSDDYAYPGRLEKQVTFLDSHADYAAVGSWTIAMDERGRLLRKIGLLPVSPGEVQSQLLFHCSLANSSVMARKAVLQEYRYRDDYSVCSDFDLWARMAKAYTLGNLPQVLVRRRMHTGRITHERAQLVKDRKLAIFRTQLTELGIACTDSDIERHFRLLHMNGADFAPDQEYLAWAGAWLLRLQEANRHVRRYPQESFAQVVSEIWVAACWQAAASLGWTAWKHFWQSPLSTRAWTSVKKYLLLLTLRRSPQDLGPLDGPAVLTHSAARWGGRQKP